MSDPTILSVFEETVDRLHDSLHRTNGGPCDAVKVLGGELGDLVEKEVVPGLPALWLFPRNSREKVLSSSLDGQLLEVELTTSVYIAVGTLYGEEARIVGKGNDIGAAALVDAVRVLLFGWAPTDAGTMAPSGFDLVLEALTKDLPVSVYEYPWTTKFKTRAVADDDGHPIIERVRQQITNGTDEEDVLLEGETELEEES